MSLQVTRDMVLEKDERSKDRRAYEYEGYCVGEEDRLRDR